MVRRQSFWALLSPFSNLYPVDIRIDNISYNSAEQYIQSEKARLFDDDIAHSRIMRECNPYRVKTIGSKIRGFKLDHWRKHAKQVAYKANLAKYSQNKTLKRVLRNNNGRLLVEGSTDSFWGIGLHLYDKKALDRRFWVNKEGGAMSEILRRVHSELMRN